MQYIRLKKFGYYAATCIGIMSFMAVPVTSAAAASGSTTTTATSKAAAAVAAANQVRLQIIISRGNNEIDRRLITLNTLGGQIASATKLTSADAATLNNTVNTDRTQLTTLKTHLDSDTTVAAAVSDAEAIILDYRVYLLVVPQVNIVKAADDQQVAEGKLTALSTKLSARITAAQQAGKNVTSMQSYLSDLNSKTAAAQAISSNMEATVITLTPSDYNTNNAVLSGDRNQLVLAQTDIQAAIIDARNIISQLPPTTS
jgi:hypothetical protein